MSQSAVSHRVAEAERRLGRPLLDRSGPARRARPTPAALALYQTAARVLPELVRAESDFIRSSPVAVEVVRIGVGSYDCYHWFPEFHRFVSARMPDVLVELAVVGDTPAGRLHEGAVDVVLASGSPAGAFITLPLFQDELMLVSHPDHHQATHPWIAPEALEDEAYLTYSRNPAPGFEFERFVRPAGVHPRTVAVIESSTVIAEMVASGLGVSILNRWALAPAIEAGRIAATRCGEDGLSLQWSALLRPNTTRDSAAYRVAELLGTWLAEQAILAPQS